MSGAEFKIERSVCAWAEANGWIQRKIQYVGRNGAPDRWFFKGSARGAILVMIEFKAPGGKCSLIQEREIDRLRKLGFNVFVIDSVEDGVNVLKSF